MIHDVTSYLSWKDRDNITKVLSTDKYSVVYSDVMCFFNVITEAKVTSKEIDYILAHHINSIDYLSVKDLERTKPYERSKICK